MSHSKSLSRREFLRLAALGGAGVALAACGGAPATSAPGATTAAEQTAQSNATVSGGVPASSGAVTVDVWIQQGAVDAAAEATKAFEKKNPDIKMNMIPTPLGETATKLLAAIAAGSGTPDLAYIEYPNMIEFTSRGGKGLTDLSDLLAPTKDQFVKWSLDLATAEGKIYGHPTDLGVAALFYRRDA